jgi:hypothetical protein
MWCLDFVHPLTAEMPVGTKTNVDRVKEEPAFFIFLLQ